MIVPPAYQNHVQFCNKPSVDTSVVPNPGMPLLLVVEMRANLAALEFVAFVEAVDSLHVYISIKYFAAGKLRLTFRALMTDSNLI